jgi:enoyl-CoA hydratase/carnithine racemase
MEPHRLLDRETAGKKTLRLADPDAEFVEFVNAFAERVSRFDLLALADIKRFVNAASLPADDALTAEADAFAEAVARPTTPSIIAEALEQGFQ